MIKFLSILVLINFILKTKFKLANPIVFLINVVIASAIFLYHQGLTNF